MDMEINKEKIGNFYDNIILSYPQDIKELFWGEKNDFIDLITGSEGNINNSDDDYVIIKCKNSDEIRFSKIMFDFLFKGDAFCKFDSPIGKRFEYNGHIFIELIESPVVKISNRIEKRGTFPITRDQNGEIESCFFIKGENPEEDCYDYPEQIIPFFVAQMKERLLKTFENGLPPVFISHFEPMKYILKIEREQENLLKKLLYKFGADLGIVERKFYETFIEIAQRIDELLDRNRNINLTDEPDENLNSLKFYISAIRNPIPYYRYLDAYHVFESFFNKCYSNSENSTSNNRDGRNVNEQQLLASVLKEYLNNESLSMCENISINLKNLLDDLSIKCNFEKNLQCGEICSLLAYLIYKFRNAIVHSKDAQTHIEAIEKNQELVWDFIRLVDKSLIILAKDVLEKAIKRW